MARNTACQLLEVSTPYVWSMLPSFNISMDTFFALPEDVKKRHYPDHGSTKPGPVCPASHTTLPEPRSPRVLSAQSTSLSLAPLSSPIYFFSSSASSFLQQRDNCCIIFVFPAFRYLTSPPSLSIGNTTEFSLLVLYDYFSANRLANTLLSIASNRQYSTEEDDMNQNVARVAVGVTAMGTSVGLLPVRTTEGVDQWVWIM